MSPRSRNPLVLLLLAAVACGGSTKSQTTTPEPAAPAEPAAGAGAEATFAPPEVELLAPGAEPRRELRFQVAKGQTGRMVMGMRFAVDIAIDGQTLTAAKLPLMQVDMDFTITDVTGEDIRYEFVVAEAKVLAEPGADPNVVKAMEAPLGTMKGLKGHAVVTSRGITREAAFEAPPRMDAQMKQTLDGMKESLRQISAPFPVEPVGVGGSWVSRSNVRANGIALEQTATYKVVSQTGEELVLDVKVEQSAAPQEVPLPGAPGSKMDLRSYAATGGGQTKLELTRLVPVDARLTIASEMQASVEGGGAKQQMVMKMELAVEMTGR